MADVKRLALFVVLLLPAAALADPPRRPPRAGEIRIEHAAEAEYDAQARRMTLSGEVHITRGTLSLWAERIVLLLDAAGSRIETGVATGGVRIRDGAREARAERADLSAGGDKVVLSGGQPRLMDGPNEILAERISYTFSTRRLVAEGGVRGFLLPDPEAATPQE